MLRKLLSRIRSVRSTLKLGPYHTRRLLNGWKILRGARLLSQQSQAVLFVTSLLRAREMKMATALRKTGWKVVLIYIETTPFKPEGCFDEVIQAKTEAEAHIYAKLLSPRICHVFSGAVDGLIYRFCADKPGPVIIDMNDIFCPALFDYCHERFEPTRECLERADGLCARDLQAKSAEKIDGFRLPRHTLLFPEYSSRDGPANPKSSPKVEPEEVRVVSVGTFCLESQGMYDSGYLRLAEMLTEQKIHFHIYPHWFYRISSGSAFNWDLQKEFVDFFRLQERTPYLHIHDSLPLDELARVLPQYDFGIVSGGSQALGQWLKALKPEYMKTCYSGRISDYLDARLPVLINREVGFNYWLLKRYGIAVDLGGILRPGFRDHLLSIKRDRKQSGKVEKAAQTMSLEKNIGRLASFYSKVIDETSREWVRLGYPLSIASGLPVFGRIFRQLEANIQQVNRRATNAHRELLAKKNETRELLSTQQKLLAQQQLMTSKLQNLGTLTSELKRQLEAVGYQVDYVPDSNSSASTSQLLTVPANESSSVGNSSNTPKDTVRRPRRILWAKRSLEMERGAQWADELHGLLNWPEIRDPAEQKTGMPELLEMVRLFGTGTGSLNQLSSCWQVLGFKNFNQLLRDGYSNFKRTIGCSYFNFLVQEGDPQIAVLESKLGEATAKNCLQKALSLPDDPAFDWHDQKTYRYFVLLLWRFAQKMDTKKLLNQIEEPEEGNPILVSTGTQRASQDLANSVLEYYSMSQAVDFGKCRKVLEIGGGYGRDAYVVLKLNPHIQYTLVDIPPAMWIAQRYMISVFGDRKVFHVREFKNYDEVREEMEQASIVCLLPHQLDLLPDRRFDLSLNISSFGEMQQEQIRNYFEALERLTNGHFYMKQWKVSQNAFDHLALTEDSYPVSPNWTQIYSRTCAVQTAFFESLYKTSGTKS